VSYAGRTAAVTVDLSVTEAQAGADNDSLAGFEGIIGGDGDHSLVGDDTLVGGGGADSLDGGDGTDVVSYAGDTTGVTVVVDGSTAGAGGDAEGDRLNDIEVLIGGDGDDSLVGADSNDTLSGGLGDDTLVGGLGADHLYGGVGTDFVSYADRAVAVTVDLSVDAQAGADNDTLVSIEGVIGSDGDDSLVGSDNADTLLGGLGADTLVGGDGADSLYGGGGDADFVSYVDRAGSVTVDLSVTDAQAGADNDTLAGGLGADLLDGGTGTMLSPMLLMLLV
jgi:Ca2+-binding RTX toxin-like protein